MSQHGLTIVTRILPGKEQELRAFLNGIGTDIGGNPHLEFAALKSVHFMRWVIVGAERVRGEELPAQLVLSTNYDGPEEAHLEELVQQGGDALKTIYGWCEGFDPGQLGKYLERHKQRNAAFYAGKPGKTVMQVQKEQALCDAIQDHLQESNPSQNWAGQNARQIREGIRKFILGQDDFSWVKQPYNRTFLQRWGGALLLSMVAAFLALMVLGFIFLPVATGLIFLILILLGWRWWASLRRHEALDAQSFSSASRNPGKLSVLVAREDYKVQNQISHLVTIKPGGLRRNTLKVILWAINLLASTVYNKGNLAGIPSIHFARWVLLDGGRRLLFFSNYDGSWESYLGTFVDKAANGLTAVWSHTEGFPPTQKLILGGARNSADFKAWVRQQQIETQVWYSAYKNITVVNATNNTAIRQGLLGDMDESTAETWLQKL